MLAIHRGKPETMGLKQIIAANVEFQYQVATRKYTNLLEKEKEKREVQEGLIKACNVIDLIIEILRGSKDRAMAKKCLIQGETEGIKFKSKESKVMASQLQFSELQANAILDMRLYKLIGLEIEALMKEHEKTIAHIYHYEDILSCRDSMTQVLVNELDLIKKEYLRKRRTVVDNCEEAIFEEKKIEEMDLMLLMDRFGYIKTIDLPTYERNKEAVHQENRFVVLCKNTGKICVFTDQAQLHTIKISEIPYGRFRDKGIPVDNVSNYLSAKEEILFVASQSQLNLHSVVFVTADSMIKIVEGSEFDVNKRTVSASKVAEEDHLISVHILKEETGIVLRSKEGYFLRFPIEEIPEKKKAAIGVRGMKLSAKDKIEEVYYLKPNEEYKVRYKEKEVKLDSLKNSKRDAKGSKIRV